MKIKFLVPLLAAALTIVLSACDDKKGSDIMDDQAGTLPNSSNNPGDQVDMSDKNAGIGENQRMPGVNPDTDVDYTILASSTVYFEFREYLAGLGLAPANLYTISYGSDRPAEQGDTEEAYSKNRRVEVGVINQK
jgi:hypothetical protein